MKLGAHTSISGGLVNAIYQAQSIGAETFQMFCKPNRAWFASSSLKEDEINDFKSELEKSGLGPIMVHDSYLINMGSPDEDKRKRSFSSFLHEYKRCEQLGISYLNFHPGSHTHPQKKLRDDEEVRSDALNRIAECMNEIIDQTPDYSCKLIIENAAGQGTNVGNSFSEIQHMIAQIKEKNRVGVCIDTQHSWASGYDWENNYDEIVNEFDETVGLDFLVGLHLNNSKTDLGSRVDRHECLEMGQMPEQVFANFMNDSRFDEKIGILETPNPMIYKEEIEWLRSLKK